jgi:hypothetical protein
MSKCSIANLEKSASFWELNPFYRGCNERNFVLSMKTKVIFK